MLDIENCSTSTLSRPRANVLLGPRSRSSRRNSARYNIVTNDVQEFAGESITFQREILPVDRLGRRDKATGHDGYVLDLR